jgi:hypothetical protein
VSGRARRGSGVSEAQHAGAVAAFLQRQADRQRREADQGAKEEAVYQKVRAGGGDATPQMIREALAASVKAEQEAERARQVAAARRAVARKPGPGRPAWTPELFHERYREARAATPGGA